MTAEVRIPDIGDVEQVEVIEICVAVGDRVEPDDALIVIESDKASMEVPAGVRGRIESVEVAVGDQVAEGALIITLAGDEAAAVQAPAGAANVTVETVATESDDTAPSPVPSQAPGTTPIEPPAVDAPGATSVEVRVPDIGDAAEVVVIEVAVTPGQQVAAEDLLVVVESDKASMEIPAGHAGTVDKVHVTVGADVQEGTLLATLRLAASSDDRAVAAAPASADQASARRAQDPEPARSESPASAPGADGSASPAKKSVYAGPAVRRLARELGVPLTDIDGTGTRGRILKDDVKGYVKQTLTRKTEDQSGIPPVPAIDFSKFGEVERVPLSRVQAAGASNLHRSWLNLPHVTQFEEADITELEAFRQTLKEEAVRRDLKITPLAFIVKACCYALQAYPTFNASLDPEVKHFILKKYYHVGFAVDTPEGLVVPVIRDADKMGVWELTAAIAELAEKARTQQLKINDMQGGTFSISSLGGIGGTGFTPIINAPEVGILGVSRLVTKPVWNGDTFAPRQMLPLSLSYDHRAINGAEAGRFIAMIAELLGDIRRLAL